MERKLNDTATTHLIDVQHKVSDNGKSIGIEIMRIIACFFVLFMHSTDFQYGKDINALTNFYELSNLAWFIFSRLSVPLFLMISGTLFLNKNYSFASITKHIMRIFIVLLFLSFGYYLLNIWIEGTNFSLSFYFKAFYSSIGQINSTFWYLYIYISFLIILPFLKLVSDNLSEKMFIYLFLITIFMDILYLFEFILSSGQQTQYFPVLQGAGSIQWLTSTIVFYPIVGCYLSKIDIKKSYCVWAWLLSFIGIFIDVVFTWIKVKRFGILDNDFQTFSWTFVYFTAIAVYISVKKMNPYFELLSNGIKSIIFSIGKGTFGVFLFHKAVLDVWNKLDLPKCSSIVGGFVNTSVLFILCLIVVLPIRKLPVIRKYL